MIFEIRFYEESLCVKNLAVTENFACPDEYLLGSVIDACFINLFREFFSELARHEETEFARISSIALRRMKYARS
jgi:hypothetical protein